MYINYIILCISQISLTPQHIHVALLKDIFSCSYRSTVSQSGIDSKKGEKITLKLEMDVWDHKGQDKKLQNLRDYKSWQNITKSAAKKFEVVSQNREVLG